MSGSSAEDSPPLLFISERIEDKHSLCFLLNSKPDSTCQSKLRINTTKKASKPGEASKLLNRSQRHSAGRLCLEAPPGKTEMERPPVPGGKRLTGFQKGLSRGGHAGCLVGCHCRSTLIVKSVSASRQRKLSNLSELPDAPTA